ncbi:MAG: Nif11-like leader peptide family natural product precursor [Eggerthellaceae bacterium]|nr:Nif11-like leader peptide family natural product precursor [Eggerthellaceae bacterium]
MNLENLEINPELREKAKACNTPEELLALAKKEGYKLSDAQMETISGGRWKTISDCLSFRY